MFDVAKVGIISDTAKRFAENLHYFPSIFPFWPISSRSRCTPIRSNRQQPQQAIRCYQVVQASTRQLPASTLTSWQHTGGDTLHSPSGHFHRYLTVILTATVHYHTKGGQHNGQPPFPVMGNVIVGGTPVCMLSGSILFRTRQPQHLRFQVHSQWPSIHSPACQAG